MPKYIIPVKSENQSADVQSLLFGLGFSWRGPRPHTVDPREFPLLYLNYSDSGSIHHSSMGDGMIKHVNNEGYTLLSAEEVLRGDIVPSKERG